MRYVARASDVCGFAKVLNGAVVGLPQRLVKHGRLHIRSCQGFLQNRR